MDPDLNMIVVDTSQLPVQHGTEIIYSCPENQIIKKEGNVKVTCNDGTISLTPETAIPCLDISMIPFSLEISAGLARLLEMTDAAYSVG